MEYEIGIRLDEIQRQINELGQILIAEIQELKETKQEKTKQKDKKTTKEEETCNNCGENTNECTCTQDKKAFKISRIEQ